jgi:alcohol dehydrogenase
VQAEYARIPFADTSMYLLPDGVRSADAVMLADILPTGYEVGRPQRRRRPGGHRGHRRRRPDRPGRDHDRQAVLAERDPRGRPGRARRRAAEALGATSIDPAASDPLEVVRAVTGGLGADAALEAVGIPATFELCTELVRPGGHVANVGVHGKPATLHLESLWIRNVTVTTGLVDTRTTPTLLRLLAAGQLDVTSLVTHRFRMDEFLDAYEVFADPAHSGALKVLVTTD